MGAGHSFPTDERSRAADASWRVLFALAFLSAACAHAERPPPPYELRAVVAPALEALAGEVDARALLPVATGEIRDELEEILGPLRAGDPGLRALAIEDARVLSPEQVATLAPLLGDEHETVECRIGVAEILAAHATPAALEALCLAAESAPEPWLRAQCAYRLGRTGEDSLLPRLLLRLKYEKDYETAFWLADACSRFGHLAGLEAMFVVWNGTSDERLRARVAERTSELAAEYGAADPNELLARWKAGMLGNASFEPSARLRFEAWRRLSDLGQWDLRKVDDARFVLAHFEAWVVPLLAEALHESQIYVRIHAAQCLERMGPRAGGALTALLAALAEPRLAPAAAIALGAIGDVRAASELERVLTQDSDPELAVGAAIALGSLAAPSSIPALRAALDPARPFDLRQAAAVALVRIEEAPDTLAFLLDCLTDERGDAGAAELALGAWIGRRNPSAPAAARLLEGWKALAPSSFAGAPAGGTLPSSAAEQDERRKKRAVLVREFLRSCESGR